MLLLAWHWRALALKAEEAEVAGSSRKAAGCAHLLEQGLMRPLSAQGVHCTELPSSWKDPEQLLWTAM
jgi:hypothetical protein